MIKNKLKTANTIISNVQGFLKIIMTAINAKKPLIALLKFFSEMAIV
ncbi:hypothetical protein FEM08_13770 [Flavobacterium gilvum]|nr:hypothetical protein FEM08_13770 [Flavobacterium gilvum]